MTEPVPDSGRTGPTIAPFVGALAVIVLVVIGIVLFNVFGSSGPDSRHGQWAGRSSARTTRCNARTTPTSATSPAVPMQGSEADFLARQRDSVAKNGERYVDDVTDIADRRRPGHGRR